MRGALSLLLQYAFMVWYSLKTQTEVNEMAWVCRTHGRN